MIVYLVRNTLNGKGYVGKTVRTLDQRWKEHVYHAAVGDDEMALYDAIRKHGPEAFVHEELERLSDGSTPADLNTAEIGWIERLGTYGRGYNMTRGGDGIAGWKHRDETKRRMSEARLGKKLGRQSKEHRLAISRGKIGTGTGPRPHMKGRKRSDEVRKKISETQYVKVAQYDLQGNLVATFDSMIEAETKTGIARQGISRCCRFPYRTSKGFRFGYVENQKGAR